jgi:hypothetical protein
MGSMMRRIRGTAIAGVVAVLFAIPAQASATGISANPSAPQAGSRTLYTGLAYGTYLAVGDVVVSGTSAVAALPGCGTFNPPASAANTIGSVSVGSAFSTGVVNTTVNASIDQNGTLRSVATSEVNSLKIFDGLISATQLKEVSTTTHDTLGYHVSTAGTVLVSLVVLGVTIQNPGVNKRINLPGIGYVIVNEQTLVQKPMSTTFTVNLLHVYVTKPNRFAAVGTTIVMASAMSGIIMGLNGTLSGFAYGTYSLITSHPAVVLSGPTASINLGCSGTQGVVHANEISGINVANQFTTGTITDTAVGTTESPPVSGETTSTLAGVNVAAGLVTADTIKSDAHAQTDGIKPIVSDAGSLFVNISVAGHPEITDAVAPNTSIAIAGLGTLWLKREYVGKNAIAIVMVELIVNQDNSLGIPIGTDIQIGVADAGAY